MTGCTVEPQEGKNTSCKNGQKRFYHAKQSARDVPKTNSKNSRNN